MELSTILVVDDEPYSLVWLKHFFHQPAAGFEVVNAAANAVNAIELIHDKRPDLIVSDIRMPEMNGIELLQYLNKESITSKVVLVSAFADFSYAQEALRHGALDYLLKPVGNEDVQRILEKAHQILHPSVPEVVVPQEAEEPFALMVEYINNHYADQIHLQDLADHVHLNANYCSILFQREAGLPFSKYLINLRISKAQHLLNCKSLPISRIASMVGYSDLFYFSKAFKQVSGFSPSQYRKQLLDTAKE